MRITLLSHSRTSGPSIPLINYPRARNRRSRLKSLLLLNYVLEMMNASKRSQLKSVSVIFSDAVSSSSILSFGLGITKDQIHCDGWSIGYDDRFPKSMRLQQALLFARFSRHDNLYAHPMVSTVPYSAKNPVKFL